MGADTAAEAIAELVAAMRAILNTDDIIMAHNIAGRFVKCEHGTPMSEPCERCDRMNRLMVVMCASALNQPSSEKAEFAAMFPETEYCEQCSEPIQQAGAKEGYCADCKPCVEEE